MYKRSRGNQAIYHASAGFSSLSGERCGLGNSLTEQGGCGDGCSFRQCGHASGRDRLLVRERPFLSSQPLLRARRQLVKGRGAGEVPQVCLRQQHAALSLNLMSDVRGIPDLLLIWWFRSEGFAPSFPPSGSAVLGEKYEAGPLSFQLH